MKALLRGLLCLILALPVVSHAATIYEGPDCHGICCVEMFVPTYPGGSYQMVNACRLTEKQCYWFCSYTCPDGITTLECGHSYDTILACTVNVKLLDLTRLECDTPGIVEPVTCGDMAEAQGFIRPCDKLNCEYDLMAELCRLMGGGTE